MNEFKPGDRVKWSGKEVELLERDEGRWSVRYAGAIHHNVRPSELTPAEPGPDAATLLVRGLCADEAETIATSADYRAGHYDRATPFIAFAKYLRANSLTVERVREAWFQAAKTAGGGVDFYAALHAALMERMK